MDTVTLQHLGPRLVEDLDRKLGKAIGEVQASEDDLTLGLALTIKVGRNKEGEVEVIFDEKGGSSKKSSVKYPAGQGTLEFS